MFNYGEKLKINIKIGFVNLTIISFHNLVEASYARHVDTTTLYTRTVTTKVKQCKQGVLY